MKPLLSFFNLSDAESYAAAAIYMKVTCGLILFSFLSLTLTGLFTAQGDSRTPFLANLIGLVGNMILDPLLILGVGPFPRLEAMGAAIATVTAQFLVMSVMLIHILRSKNEKNVLKKLKLFSLSPGKYYRSICRIGLPTALQSSLYCMISMVLTRMISGFGAAAVATQRVGGQIESLSWNTADGFGAALNAFVGQNYGAKKSDRIRKGYSISLRILVVWGALISAAFIFLPTPISHLFFHEAQAIRISAEYLVILGFSEIFMCVELMTVGALSGLGKTTLCSLISITLTGVRIPLAIFLTGSGMGLSGIWWALTISSIAKGILFFLTFKYTERKL